MIKVAFRFDDPSITSDHHLEREIIALCRKYETTINFAVIPFKVVADHKKAFTKSTASHLIDAFREGIIEISQHGNAHINHAGISAQIPSEFSGLNAELQFEMVTEGKQLLDQLFGEQKRGFVPPWNSFDLQTISALETCGFSFISAGTDVPTGTKPKLLNLPRTTQLSSLRTAIEHIVPFEKLNPIVIAVLHHYDFDCQSGSFSLSRFEELLLWLTKQEEILITSLDSLAFNENSFAMHKAIDHYNLYQSAHWRLRRKLPQNCLIPTSILKSIPPIAKNLFK